MAGPRSKLRRECPWPRLCLSLKRPRRAGTPLEPSVHRSSRRLTHSRRFATMFGKQSPATSQRGILHRWSASTSFTTKFLLPE